jgi:hypothetical protein
MTPESEVGECRSPRIQACAWLTHGIARAALVLGVVAPLPSVAEAPIVPQMAAPSGKAAKLTYAVYLGSMKTLLFEATVRLSDAAYEVHLKGHTTGVADWLFDWRIAAETEGRLAKDGVQPDRYLSDVRQRGRLREVTLKFGTDGSIQAAVEPPPEADDREPVTPEQQRGAIDPISTMLVVARALAAAQGCHRSVPVFDGRRRYDLELLDRGRAMVKTGDRGKYGGEATVCDFRFKPVAGYQKLGSRERNANDAERTYRGWIAPALRGFPPIPVRVEAEAWLGFLTVELLGSSPVQE